MKQVTWFSGKIRGEFEGVALGDPRRERRLLQVAERLDGDPTASFPDLFSDSAELEGFYRFLRNENFDWTDVVSPHVNATCRRAKQAGECLVIHDTTDFTFKGHREGLGATSSRFAQGFMAHVSLVVANDAARTPLGVGAFEQYVRTELRGRRSKQARLTDEFSESKRWLRGAKALEELSAGSFQCIHVADREGDSFPFLSGMLDLDGRFVVRVAQDRRVLDDNDDASRLHELVTGVKCRAKHDISISKSGKRSGADLCRRYPSRGARSARVSIGATTVCVPVPGARRKSTDIELNLVRIWEEKPPKDTPAVEWILWTTEPIDTVSNLRRVLNIYRARWTIEEYFKALKTGCQFEKRQLESFSTLSTALALFIPVAWKLLLARSVMRAKPNSPATKILTPLQIRYLENRYRKRIKTAMQAFSAVARLGGHLSQNGEAGWQTLGRGYEKLVSGEAFYNLLI